MDKKIIKLIGIIGIGFMVSSYNACSSPYSSSNSSIDAASQKAFSDNLHPILEQNCATCHGNNQQPLFAVSDVAFAFDEIERTSLVDLESPLSSYMIKKLDDGHSEIRGAVIDQIQAGIEEWARVVNNYKEQTPGGGTPINFKGADDSTVLAKVKSLVHGGAVTDQEYQAYLASSDKQEALKGLVDNWSTSVEGQEKIKFFLSRSLHQDTTDSTELFDNGNVVELNGSMRESFARTALDIINSNRPFTEVATTTRFAVNSVLLMGYAYQDRRSTPGNDNFRIRNLINDRDQGSDYNDWRFINFAQNDAEQVIPSDDTNTAGEANELFNYYRGLSDGDTVTFSIPRVGYFSTLAFQSKYPSNVDNQYRVTVNQALIGGLGKTFSPVDNTPQPNAVHMDDEHAPENSECYECHISMDPMRNIFRNKMNNEYRFDSEFSNDLSSFAFFGKTMEMRNLSDFGEAIATHPDFASAWVQKLCIAFNSSRCISRDPEVQRIAQRFQRSDFDFKTLYREIASSPLVTAAEATTTVLTNGYVVNRVRGTSFCQSVGARLRQMQAARGVAVDTFDNGNSICSNDTIEDAIESLGDDITVRGEVDVVNSFTLDTFARQTIDTACYGLGDIIVRAGSDYISNSADDIEESFDLITQYLVGLPPSNPRYAQVRQAVKAVYVNSNEQLDFNFGDSMRQAIAFGCTTPDFIGVGL